MKNWEDDDDDEYCSTRQDLIDCASVAEVIGIDLEVVNFSAEYKERVFSAFLARILGRAHAQPGRAVQRRDQVQGAFSITPMTLGARRIATGHYARLRGSRRTLRAAQGSRPVKGPELFPAPAQPGASSRA